MRPYDIKLLEECSEEQQTAREQYWYDTRMPLYNKQRPGNDDKERRKAYRLTPARQAYEAEYRKSDARQAVQARYMAKKKASTDTTCVSGQT